MEVLEVLVDREIETLDWLHDRHWRGQERKSAYNRLKRLAGAGYLEHVMRAAPDAPPLFTGRNPAQHLFLLGPKAPIALSIRDRDVRSLARRQRRGGIPAALIDHQLVTNRVGDWLGTRLMRESEASIGMDRGHRPDAAYRATPDEQGRDLVLVEIDRGHYSRQRILEKATAMLGHAEARSVLFACPTEERASLVARWVRERYGGPVMWRIQFFSYDELERGALLDEGTHPVEQRDPAAPSAYPSIMGRPGCR